VALIVALDPRGMAPLLAPRRWNNYCRVSISMLTTSFAAVVLLVVG